MWRSLVARVVRDDEAVSSSLTTPTTRNHEEAAIPLAASLLLALLPGLGRMLVAFREGPVTQLLLLEAKAETGWTNKQTLSKARRLCRIFGSDGLQYPTVKPHFSLLSPRPPQKLDVGEWPVWMTRGGKPIWLKLSVPPGLRKITRCDENGRQSSAGGFFRVSRNAWRTVQE